MAASVRIGIIGDFKPGYRKHVSTNEALAHTAARLELPLESAWIHSRTLADDSGLTALAECDGLIAGPQSPAESLDGVLAGIRFAREHGRPFLGTCGGFQHTLLEYARHVLGIADAAHPEYHTVGGTPLVVPISCVVSETPDGSYRLAGRMPVDVEPDSLALAIYGQPQISEEFSCNYELNPAFAEQLARSGLRIVGRGSLGQARLVELRDHPFFLASAFLPQWRSTPEQPHPLLVAYLQAVRRAQTA